MTRRGPSPPIPSVSKISELARPHLGRFDEAWLFGSVARGDADPRSDLDYLVIYDGEVPITGWTLRWPELESLPGPKDILVLSKAEWDRLKAINFSFARTILREGVRLK